MTDAKPFTDPSPAALGRQCFLCGGKRFRLLHGWDVGESRNSALIPLAVWQCDCGIVLLHPVPKPEQLPDRGDWWADGRAQVSRRPWLKRWRRKLKRPFIGTAMYRLIKDTHRVVPSGRLLDIGCGTGIVLDEAARYYQCAGLDPSERALAAARQQGHEVIHGTLEDARLADETFDVVVMYSVIEHVVDPLQALQIAYRVLRPGGVVVLQTPKFGGLAYRCHGKDWNGFRVGYHTFLFDGRSLGTTLERAGFAVLTAPKRDRLLDDILILWGQKPTR